MIKKESDDAEWSVSIPQVAIWRRRVLCDALPGVAASPQK